MNIQKLVLAVIAAYIVMSGVALGLNTIFVSQLESVNAMFTAGPSNIAFFGGYLLHTIVFGYIFTLGYENKGIMEGVRFGLLIGALKATLELVWYSMTMVTLSGLIWWGVTDLIIYAAGGAALAALYRPADEAAA